MRGSCHYQFSVLTDYATEFCTRIQSRVHSYHRFENHFAQRPHDEGRRVFQRGALCPRAQGDCPRLLS